MLQVPVLLQKLLFEIYNAEAPIPSSSTYDTGVGYDSIAG